MALPFLVLIAVVIPIVVVVVVIVVIVIVAVVVVVFGVVVVVIVASIVVFALTASLDCEIRRCVYFFFIENINWSISPNQRIPKPPLVFTIPLNDIAPTPSVPIINRGAQGQH